MADIKVYHNPRCTKSRESLAYLDDKGQDYETVEYMKNPISSKELKEVIKKLGIKASELVRTTEAVYKSDYKGKDLSEDEWIEAMIKEPKLMQRPIIVKNKQAVIGRPASNIDSLLK